MGLPSNISRIKIHPAVGIARLSTNPDWFVFGDAVEQYKSNNLIKRQAVQFRLFAYGAAGEGVEELTPERLNELGVRVVWRARVTNRKVVRLRQQDDSYAIVATASSDDANAGRLTGRCRDFEE